MKKLLLIEDETDFMYALSIRLGSFGWEVHSSDSPERGIELARDLSPDLIILDVMFRGGMDGYQAAQQIKADSALKKIPVVLLTVKATEDDIKKGLEAGADEYFTKPIDDDSFIERIKELLSE